MQALESWQGDDHHTAYFIFHTAHAVFAELLFVGNVYTNL